MLEHVKRILVRDPNLLSERLFANVVYVDLLHWELNCCDYAFDALTGVMTKAMKVECDNNAKILPMFRNPDGSTIRRFDQVTTLTYLTTARRVTLMFVWVHALDTQALMLSEECRRPALVMISSMQAMILAAQGRRSYTIAEWQRLHVDTAMEFFGAMEHLMYYKQKHDTKKDATKFKPMARFHDISHMIAHI